MNVTTKIEHEWQADAVIAAAKAKGRRQHNGLKTVKEYLMSKLMIGGHEVKIGRESDPVDVRHLVIGCTTVTKEQWEAAGKLAGWK